MLANVVWLSLDQCLSTELNMVKSFIEVQIQPPTVTMHLRYVCNCSSPLTGMGFLYHFLFYLP
jgi:hypothetical protein